MEEEERGGESWSFLSAVARNRDTKICSCLSLPQVGDLEMRGGKQEEREREKRKGTSLHDGSVNDGLDVVLSVSGVDDSLPFGVLFDVVL